MRVITHVLCMVDDHRYVLDQTENSEAVAELVKAYNQLANRSTESSDPDDHLFVVGNETYGSDLKQWISMMPIHDQWRLLDRYLSHFPQYAEGDAKTERHSAAAQERETEEAKDQRKLRHFFLKFGAVVLFLMTLLVFAAGMALMSTKHMLPDNVVLKALFETATELAKILFTLK